METQNEYYYTYYSYEEYGRGYFGSRTCKCPPEKDVNYFGSFYDKTFTPTQKIILKSDYSNRAEAIADEIILQQHYKVVENQHFANRAYQTSTKFYVPRENAIENGKKGGKISGKKNKEKGIGIFSLTSDQLSKNGKNGAIKCKQLGLGIHGLTKEELSDAGKKGYENGLSNQSKDELSELGKKGGKIGGKNSKELGVGIHGLTKEELSDAGKKGYEKGLHLLTTEQLRENAKKVNSQVWQCTVTGYQTTAGALSSYQNKRGIDTSNRIRVS
jgi:general stress protein YciG